MDNGVNVARDPRSSKNHVISSTGAHIRSSGVRTVATEGFGGQKVPNEGFWALLGAFGGPRGPFDRPNEGFGVQKGPQ